MAGPDAAPFGRARVEQDQVFAGFGIRMIVIGRVEVCEMLRRIFAGRVAQRPAYLQKGPGRVEKLDARRFEKWHGKVTGEVDPLRIKTNIHGKGFDEVFAVV